VLQTKFTGFATKLAKFCKNVSNQSSVLKIPTLVGITYRQYLSSDFKNPTLVAKIISPGAIHLKRNKLLTGCMV
jgi:hypothetical protein